ncbi:MAG: GntR family transcriptional regulator [Firmicutes bacterium]|nr:GntR family transcriptional regulator [Bacillota bacterium]
MKTFQTKHEQVYEALRAAIISGEIAPGERINIRQVARQFEVSDIPVREALKALAGENLIQIVPYAGAVAAPISGKDVAEVGEIRLMLEPWGTGLAATHLSQSDLRQMADYLDEMDRALASGDMASFANADRIFHGLIFSRCPNERLGELLSSLWTASERNVLGLRKLPDHAARSQAEHRVLFQALERHDAKAAEEAARRHRLGLLERLSSLVAELPNSLEVRR